MHISHNISLSSLNPSFESCMILGCGNPLLGDDGFGPAVIALLRQELAPYPLPPGFRCIDVGASLGQYCLDFLLRQAPQTLIVVDACWADDLEPGNLHVHRLNQQGDAEDIPFALHAGPNLAVLQELQRLVIIDIILIAAQMAALPQTIAPGLSAAMQRAVRYSCDLLLEAFFFQMQGSAP